MNGTVQLGRNSQEIEVVCFPHWLSAIRWVRESNPRCWRDNFLFCFLLCAVWSRVKRTFVSESRLERLVKFIQFFI